MCLALCRWKRRLVTTDGPKARQFIINGSKGHPSTAAAVELSHFPCYGFTLRDPLIMQDTVMLLQQTTNGRSVTQAVKMRIETVCSSNSRLVHLKADRIDAVWLLCPCDWISALDTENQSACEHVESAFLSTNSSTSGLREICNNLQIT